MSERARSGRSPWGRVRGLLRALHRDMGYLVVGLTFVYALSGLAVNHIGAWDPNFQSEDVETTLEQTLPPEADAAARVVLQELGLDEEPVDVYRSEDGTLEVTLERGNVYVQPDGRTVTAQIERPRWLLRTANWLHLNRGKAAWTYVADAYAVLLLALAVSGLFMIPGRKGLRGRGAVLVLVGIAVPVAYVVWSGGP